MTDMFVKYFQEPKLYYGPTVGIVIPQDIFVPRCVPTVMDENAIHPAYPTVHWKTSDAAELPKGGVPPPYGSGVTLTRFYSAMAGQPPLYLVEPSVPRLAAAAIPRDPASVSLIPPVMGTSRAAAASLESTCRASGSCSKLM